MSPLGHMVILLLAAVVAVPLCKRLGLGAVIGYLAAGMLLGPSGLDLFSDIEGMLHFSEFGVVMLMFIIGLELQPSRLKALRRPIFGLGSLQLALCSLAIGALAWAFGRSFIVVFVVGTGLALSSTAFVLQLLAEKDQLSAAHGRLAFTILLFQDLAVIPLLALLPVLSGGEGDQSARDIAVNIVEVVAIFAAIVLVGRFLVRPILHFIHATGVREISIAIALLMVTGVAWIMAEAGLSMALGAFVAGVLLADSEYRHQLEADIDPFKGLLLGLFFLSVGMTLNLGLVVSDPLLLVGLALLLMLAKTVLVFVIGRAFGSLDNDSAWRLGLLLSQGGEFGFVVFALAGQLEIFPPGLQERLIVVVTLSMIFTPLLYTCYERLLAPLLKPAPEPFDTIEPKEGSVVIAGFGRFGQIAGRLLATLQIPFTALDVSPDQVQVVRRFGNKVHFGDAAQLDVLRAAGLDGARVLVLAIDDVEASLRAAAIVRQNFPEVEILARARNRIHAHRLMDAGVEWIIRETFLSSLALAEKMLIHIGRSPDEAKEIVRLFRETDEESLRRQHGIHHDQQRIIQSTQEAADELQRLFEGDREARESER
jgi:monovalent cation:proton antiporter-2 (CPA2) family protein